MKRFFDNPQSLLVWWLMLGLLMGLTFGYSMNNLMAGLPLGLIMVLWMVTVTQRVGRNLKRERRF